jgi:hypothetical protein
MGDQKWILGTLTKKNKIKIKSCLSTCFCDMALNPGEGLSLRRLVPFGALEWMANPKVFVWSLNSRNRHNGSVGFLRHNFVRMRSGSFRTGKFPIARILRFSTAPISGHSECGFP